MRRQWSFRRHSLSPWCARALLLAGLLVGARPVGATTWSIEDPGQGIFPFAPPVSGSIELSGLAWVAGDLYLAVSDRLATLHALRIDLDPAGRIASATVYPGVRLDGATDPEGVVYVPGSATVFVSDEQEPSIREYEIATGRTLREVALPEVFAKVRRNLGLESLARDPATGVAWTVSEEALSCDGQRTGATAGSLVRLQRFDHAWHPDGQWAYRTEALAPDIGRMNGVSDLVALPDGGLLVLERAHTAAGVRVALWAVDLDAAPDTSARASLATDTPVVRKTLLWQAATGNFNFEGAALGSSTADGGRSLLLVSDDGRNGESGLYPLVLHPAPAPEPRPGATPTWARRGRSTRGALSMRRTRRRELR